jgi:small subunit ribosomal protein S30e
MSALRLVIRAAQILPIVYLAHHSLAESCLYSKLDLSKDNAHLFRPSPSTSNMGKVHGSLARAGKVKAATPKVEPQEKKKNPKGRAYKRVLYTRRFVNVTMTGGKRKMNPNPGQ